MALKDIFRFGKKQESEKNELEQKNDVIGELMGSDSFPIVHAADVDMSRYRKIPWNGIALLGAAFSMLPKSARAIMQTTTTEVATGGNFYMGWNPNGVAGVIRDYGKGISGNIVNPDTGKIVGRMRFKALDSLPVTQTTTAVMPLDPLTMAIAAVLMNIDKKLDALQQKAEEILQFLKLEKQSVQRGNLNMLAEILNEYKQNCANESLCALRNAAVQDIKIQAHKDILFYQEQITRQLHHPKIFHGNKQSQELLASVMSEFREYQLACYLYGFSTFLDVMLQKNFDQNFLNGTIQRMEDCTAQYAELYMRCRELLGEYHHNSFENKLFGAVGTATKALGKGINAVPWLNKSPIDEMLIMSGESIEERNKEAAAKHLEQLSPLEDCHLHTFIENIHAVDLMYNQKNSMLMDSENLYVLESA